MSPLTLIVAATKSNGIGKSSRLPWRLPQEMAYFARVTSNSPEGQMNAVIMGRKTWESIPAKFRPLGKRVNVVISRNDKYELHPISSSTPAYLHSDLKNALDLLSDHQPTAPIHRQFIVGGASLYCDALALSLSSPAFVDRVLLTRILSPAFEDCDIFMPDFLAETTLKDGHEVRWKRSSHQDLQEWVGFDVPMGVQEENGIQYEFQMWTR